MSLCFYRNTIGLHHAIALCMNRCQAAEATVDGGWFKTVVLAGGTACLLGLPGKHLILSYVPAQIKVCVTNT